jgi:hypothetical protein
VTALDARSSSLGGAADRLRSTSRGTRALYITSSALTGAVLYLLLNWPHPHAQVQTRSFGSVSSVPAPAIQAPIGNVRQPDSLAGLAILEAVRAVGGSAQAREGPKQDAQVESPVTVPVAAAPAAISMASSNGARPLFAVPPAAESASSTAAAAAPVDSTSVDARQPVVSGLSPNRIGVPGGQIGITPANTPSSGGVPNHISIPATPPR